MTVTKTWIQERLISLKNYKHDLCHEPSKLLNDDFLLNLKPEWNFRK